MNLSGAGAKPLRKRPRWAFLGPFALFVGLGVLLAIGLTRNLRDILSPLLGKPVPEFRPPTRFAVVATDLRSGAMAILERADLGRAVQASSARHWRRRAL